MSEDIIVCISSYINLMFIKLWIVESKSHPNLPAVLFGSPQGMGKCAPACEGMEGSLHMVHTFLQKGGSPTTGVLCSGMVDLVACRGE